MACLRAFSDISFKISIAIILNKYISNICKQQSSSKTANILHLLQLSTVQFTIAPAVTENKTWHSKSTNSKSCKIFPQIYILPVKVLLIARGVNSGLSLGGWD